MKTRSIAAALAAATSLTIAGAANAGIIVGSLPGAPDPGPRAGESLVIDFEAPQAGVTLSGQYLITSGSSGTAAAPALDATKYLSVPDNLSAGTQATMMFATFLGNTDVLGFSFYWGSIDDYNTIELLHRDGSSYASIGGGLFPPASGDRFLSSTNRRVTFDLSGSDENLGGIRFTSTNYAIETDDYSFKLDRGKGGGVPEPATWAMMIGGFFGVGAMVRRRRETAATA